MFDCLLLKIGCGCQDQKETFFVKKLLSDSKSFLARRRAEMS